ncbi:DUF1801 domain-containing protein [bacterium]|nr:MAG: DUF1801 domain-containing protein [bacterium]
MCWATTRGTWPTTTPRSTTSRPCWRRRVKSNPAAKTPEEYLASVPEERRADLTRLHNVIREVAPELEAVMIYGMLGYGPFHYKYASGREGDGVKIALANQKSYISLYCSAADENGSVAEEFKERLPKANIGKSCVRFKRLSDLDEVALRDLIAKTAATDVGV